MPLPVSHYSRFHIESFLFFPRTSHGVMVRRAFSTTLKGILFPMLATRLNINLSMEVMGISQILEVTASTRHYFKEILCGALICVEQNSWLWIVKFHLLTHQCNLISTCFFFFSSLLLKINLQVLPVWNLVLFLWPKDENSLCSYYILDFVNFLEEARTQKRQISKIKIQFNFWFLTLIHSNNRAFFSFLTANKF